ncbi:Oxidoreductase ptaL [Fusarium oxysporum f. sp. albedinis]|nr:Oxidoreductase ptaL [Fusarium oxysporum f. sp. albedinis]
MVRMRDKMKEGRDRPKQGGIKACKTLLLIHRGLRRLETIEKYRLSARLRGSGGGLHLINRNLFLVFPSLIQCRSFKGPRSSLPADPAQPALDCQSYAKPGHPQLSQVLQPLGDRFYPRNTEDSWLCLSSFNQKQNALLDGPFNGREAILWYQQPKSGLTTDKPLQ